MQLGCLLEVLFCVLLQMHYSLPLRPCSMLPFAAVKGRWTLEQACRCPSGRRRLAGTPPAADLACIQQQHACARLRPAWRVCPPQLGSQPAGSVAARLLPLLPAPGSMHSSRQLLRPNSVTCKGEKKTHFGRASGPAQRCLWVRHGQAGSLFSGRAATCWVPRPDGWGDLRSLQQ